MTNQSDIVCGLGFGDEGKGVVVARLVDEAVRDCGVERVAIVRYSGGPQNAHNVCWCEPESGREWNHTFAQIGSSGRHWVALDTFTAKYVPVDPIALFCEADRLQDGTHEDAYIARVCARQFFHEESLLVLPMHEQISRLREQRLGHGSTGRGIFEVNKFAEIYPESAPRLRDLVELPVLVDKLKIFLKWANAGMPNQQGNTIIEEGVFRDMDAVDEAESFINFCENTMGEAYRTFKRNILADSDWLCRVGERQRLIWEGGQGVLLDKRFGFFPNVTFSNTTPINAVDVIHRLKQNSATHIHGITRTYATRHGAGLLPGEISGNNADYNIFASNEKHNTPSFAGTMRYAPLSASLMEYAMEICKLDGCALTDIHITHCDVLQFAVVPQMKHNQSGCETANLAYTLIDNDIERQSTINTWGRRLADHLETATQVVPETLFAPCNVHCHSSPNIANFAEGG